MPLSGYLLAMLSFGKLVRIQHNTFTDASALLEWDTSCYNFVNFHQDVSWAHTHIYTCTQCTLASQCILSSHDLHTHLGSTHKCKVHSWNTWLQGKLLLWVWCQEWGSVAEGCGLLPGERTWPYPWYCSRQLTAGWSQTKGSNNPPQQKLCNILIILNAWWWPKCDCFGL